MNAKHTKHISLIFVFILSLLWQSLVSADDEDENEADLQTNLSNSYDLQELGGMTGRLSPHGNDLMGDLIDKNTGGIVFEHTDVSIPGNSSLEVALRRKLKQGATYDTPYQHGFGDWLIDLPIAYTSYAPNPGTPKSPQFDNGCLTNHGPMRRSTNAAGGVFVLADQHVSGVTLNVPGKGLSGYLSDPAMPQDPKSNWVSAPNSTDYAGRCATVVIASDGTKYKFGRHVFRTASSLTFPYTIFPSYDYDIPTLHQTSVRRRYAVYLVTEVIDVNGNWVRYDYTNDSRAELTRIYSNDQREIRVAYNHAIPNPLTRNSRQISRITSNNRSWNYTYSNHSASSTSFGSLYKVTLPDGRYWRLGTPSNGMREMSFEVQVDYECLPRDFTFSMKHPDGAIGTFRLLETRHIKNAIDTGSTDDAWDHWMQATDIPHVADNSKCNDRSNPQKPPFYRNADWPIYRTMSLASKTISGSGLPTAKWSYQYRNYSGGALDNNWTKITGPDGTQQKFTHTAIGLDHGLLKRIDVTPTRGAGEVITYDYNLTAPVNSTCVAGGAYGDSTGMCHTFKKRPVTKHVQWRDGNSYITETTYNQNGAKRFIDYGYPNKVRRFSSVPGSTNARETVTSYSHKLSINVLGLKKRVTQNGRELAGFNYDSLGRLVNESRYGKAYARYTYHNSNPYRGALASEFDAMGREVYRTDYKRGIPERTRRPDNLWLSVSVDNNGWLMSSTDAMSNTTSYSRDNMGRLKLINPPGPWNNTSVNYNFSNGGVVQTITRGQSRETITYDKMYRPVLERTQALDTGWSSYINTKYHPAGQVKFTSQPSFSRTEGKGTDYTYDGLGRLTQSRENVAPFATERHRYLNNNSHEFTDAEGHKTITLRDGYAGAGEGSTIGIKQPLGVNTTLHRNIWGQLTRLQQAGNVNGFNMNQSQYYYYDSMQRLCRYRTPEGGDTLSQYDASGFLTMYAKGMSYGTTCSVPSGASKVTLIRDSLARVTKTDFADVNTPDIVKTYDPNSNVLTNKRAGVDWVYSYDELNHLKSEKLSVDGKNFNLSYRYDKNENLIQRNFPSNRIVTYNYDGLGREKSALSSGVYYANNISYHSSGAVSSMTYGNGQVFTQILNKRLLPQRLIAQKSGTKAMDVTYAYDGRGDITRMTDATDSNNYRLYAYDGLGRLTIANGPWGAGSFTYDALGNLRYKELGSRRVTVNYNSANRAIQSTDTAGSTRKINYDKRGNVTRLGQLVFNYDYSDQPTSLSGSTSGSYLYDGNMKRVKAVANGKTIYNVYDSSGTLVHVSKGSGKTILIPYKKYQIPVVTKGDATDYIKVAGMTIARVTKDSTSYLHSNHLGSPVAGTNVSGLIDWKEQYTPYGEKRIANAANNDHGSFTGHIDDSATGLTYMQARYYDPVIGRFLSNDPVTFLDIQNPIYFNRYSYSGNDPVNNTDPTGEACVPCATGLIGGIVGGISGGVTQVVSDVAFGDGFSLENTVGAVAGGAVSGAIIGATGNVAAGITAGAATQSATTQKLTTGKIDGTKLVAETAVGATLGKVPGLKVPGITSGTGSFTSVIKGQTTKIAKGSQKNISAKTLGKGIAAGVVGGVPSTAAGIITNKSGLVNVIDQGFENIKSEICGSDC